MNKLLRWFLYPSGCKTWAETKEWFKSPFTSKYWVGKWRLLPNSWKKYWPLIIFIAVFTFFDIVSTLVALELGFTEKNTLYSVLIESGRPWIPLRVGLGAGLAFFFFLIRKSIILHGMAIGLLVVVYGNTQAIVYYWNGRIEPF